MKTAALPAPSTYLQDCLGKNQTTTHHAKSKAKGNHIIYKHKMQMVYSFSFCFLCTRTCRCSGDDLIIMYRLRGDRPLNFWSAQNWLKTKISIIVHELSFFSIPLGFPVDSKPKSRAYYRMFVSYDALKIHDALKIQNAWKVIFHHV